MSETELRYISFVMDKREGRRYGGERGPFESGESRDAGI